MAAKGWSREFDDPIILPCGGQLQTLRDAGNYASGMSWSPRRFNSRLRSPLWSTKNEPSGSRPASVRMTASPT